MALGIGIRLDIYGNGRGGGGGAPSTAGQLITTFPLFLKAS